MTEKIVTTNSNEATAAIFGSFDVNVRKIERAFDVRISNRNAERGYEASKYGAGSSYAFLLDVSAAS